TNDVFENNHASGSGGAVYITSTGGATVANALFANNSASQGGAIAMELSSSATINYATIAGSGAQVEAISLSNSSALTLRNALISGYSSGVKINNAQASLSMPKVLMANDGANNVAT